jgi:hypothetical protein
VKIGSTGLFDIVELKMAKSPALHNNMKGEMFISTYSPHAVRRKASQKRPFLFPEIHDHLLLFF